MGKWQRRVKAWLMMIILPLAMYLLFLALSSIIGVGSFGSGLSMRTALRNAMYTCLVAIGMSFNLLANRWDYSIGAVMVLASIIGPRMAQSMGLSAPFALIFCAIVGIIFSGIVGLVYIIARIPPLIISMGFLLFWEGFSALIYNGEGVNMTGNALMNIAKYPTYLIPFAIFFVIAYVVYTKTQIGYDIRAISYGPQVASNIGVKEKRAIFMAYALGGLFVGAAGYFHTAMSGTIWPATSASSVVTAFSCCIAVFIGKFLSRYGNMMVGIVMGSLTLAFMNSGLSSLGISSSLQTTFNGFFLLVFLIFTGNQVRVSKYFESKKIAAQANAKLAGQGPGQDKA